jgi:hypothetical protein
MRYKRTTAATTDLEIGVSGKQSIFNILATFSAFFESLK